MSVWEPPDAGADAGAQPTQPMAVPAPYAAAYGPPPAWGQPWPGATPPGAPARLPWYRSTPFLILGSLAMLLVGAGIGAVVTFVGTSAATSIGDSFSSADVTTYGTGGDLERFAVGRGQCATQDLFAARSYDEGSASACEATHGIEHYASVEPPGLDADGEVGRLQRDDLNAFADSACYLAFEPFVGLAYVDSDYDYVPIVPSDAAWRGGARTIHCVLVPVDGTATRGSARGSGR